MVGTKRTGAPQRALITGATGLVGRALAEALTEQAWAVRALVRRTSDVAHLRELGVDLFVGDITDADSLEIPLESVDVVFHCAAAVGDWGTDTEFRRVNVRGTENVLNAAIDAGVRRFVHLSSVVVYGKTPRPEMTEAMPYSYCGDPYYDTKIDAEKAVFEAAKRIEVVAIRPGVIYGPGDRHFLPRLVRIMRRVPLPRFLGVDAIANLAYVQNVAALCIQAAQHRRAKGQAFNIIDSEPMRLVNALRLIATKANAYQPLGAVLPEAMQLGADIVETAWKALGISTPPPLTRFAIDGALVVRPYSIEKARWVLNFRPPYPMRDGLLRALAECDLAGDELDVERPF